MKHWSITSFRSQISSQLSGQQQVKAVRSEQRDKHQQARFWRQYFGMRMVFLFIDYLEKGRTINIKYYIALLVSLKEELVKKRPQMKKKNVLFHQDNAPGHKLIVTMAKLHGLHFELLPHSPYSPDVAHSGYWLFVDLKRMLQRKRFSSKEEVISENWGVFWGQKQTVLQERHRIGREALESEYQPRTRLCWWIKSNFA